MTEQIKSIKGFSDYMAGLKESMAGAIKNSNLSRIQIADKMNRLISRADDERDITVSQIDSWTKKDDKRTAFVKYLPIFCYVVQDYAPLQEFVAAIGLKISGPRELNLISLGEAELNRLEATKKRKIALGVLGWRTEDVPEDTYDNR